MNTLSWIITNLILLIVALVTALTMRQVLKTPLPEVTIEKVESAKLPDKRVTLQTNRRQNNSRQKNVSTADVWKKSLFRPERTEETGVDGSVPQQADPNQENSEFELVGLAQMGVAGKATVIAVILQKNQGRENKLRRRKDEDSEMQDKKSPETKIKSTFRIGDHINQTGYVLSEIDTKENTVTLTRGRESVTLKITLGDESSRKRKNAAVTAAAKRQEEREIASQEAAEAQRLARGENASNDKTKGDNDNDKPAGKSKSAKGSSNSKDPGAAAPAKSKPQRRHFRRRNSAENQDTDSNSSEQGAENMTEAQKQILLQNNTK